MSNPCECENSKQVRAEIRIYCKKCSNEIRNITLKRPLAAAGITVLIAYGGGHVIEDMIVDNRYPLAVEYNLLEVCSKSYRKPMSLHEYGKKQSVCLCSLEETMNEIPYFRYKDDEKAFLKAFDQNVTECL